MSKKDALQQNEAAILSGMRMAMAHPLIAPIALSAFDTRSERSKSMPLGSWATVMLGPAQRWHSTAHVDLYANVRRKAEPEEWAYVFARVCVHQALNHFEPRRTDPQWHAACWATADALIMGAGVGRRPVDMMVPTGFSLRDERELAHAIGEHGLPLFASLSLGEVGAPFWAFHDGYKVPDDLPKNNARNLATGIRNAALQAIGGIQNYEGRALSDSLRKAVSHLTSEHPLLAALVASFDWIEDKEFCEAQDIPVAAVFFDRKEIMFNPNANLSYPEAIFVGAHEILHVGLRHDVRCKGRDHELWNVACDYAINAWLIEMRIGTPPDRLGYLFDEALKGLSAEDIYDRIRGDLRLMRKLKKLRGVSGDMISEKPPEWWTRGGGVDLDTYYRRALAEGLRLHQRLGRGLLPGNLVEEIQALEHPPIPWEVELGQWLDGRIRPLIKRRTYSRASRRQSASPDIPRPAWYLPEQLVKERTFGVLLDTSGSMDAKLLGRALGAVCSYAMNREVSHVRLVQCDAHPHDVGYVKPRDLDGKVEVHGRGGTVLAPGIKLLDEAEDFPKDAPILIITDGGTDVFKCFRPHAFLMPEGGRLPFRPDQPIFRMIND